MFTIPIVIGTRAQFPVLSVLIYQELNIGYPPRTGQAVTLSILMLVLVQLSISLEYVAGRRAGRQAMRSRANRSTVTRLGPWKWVGRASTTVYVLAGTVLPILGLAYVSIQQFWLPQFSLHEASVNSYRGLLHDEAARIAFRNSILLGAGGATVGMLIAALMGLLSRNANSWVGRMTGIMTGLPASVPHTVVGVGFLVSFGTGFLHLTGTLTLLLIAYVVMYLPQASRAANSAYAQVGRDLTEASSMSGAGELRTFIQVLLPQMAGGLIAGWVLVFVLMFNEVTASVFLATNSSSVIGPYIIDLWLNIGDYPKLAAMSIMLCLANSVIVLLMLALGRRTTKIHSV
jgi:iron(III) transport system permease protein